MKIRSIFTPPSITSGTDDSLISRAINGVLRNAQEGHLPLFSWTLGLPQSALLYMLEQNFPETKQYQPMPLKQYNLIKNTTLQSFFKLQSTIEQQALPQKNKLHIDWLSRLLSAGCFGNRPLWEELNLANNPMLSGLITQYFLGAKKNFSYDYNWQKHFLNLAGLEQLSSET